MKVTISTLVLLVLGVSYVRAQQCHLREIDLCMATGMFHYQSSGVPDDDEKVTEWCDTVTEVKHCMSNYSEKCMSPVQRELITLLSDGANDAEKKLCTPGTELRNTYLKHGACLAEGAESDVFKGLVRDVQVVIEHVFDIEFKDRLPTLCCGYRRLIEGARDNTRNMCGEEAVEMLDFIMNMIVTELPKTVCQNFDHTSDTCKQLLPAEGTTPKGAESKSQIAKLMDTVFGNL